MSSPIRFNPDPPFRQHSAESPATPNAVRFGESPHPELPEVVAIPFDWKGVARRSSEKLIHAVEGCEWKVIKTHHTLWAENVVLGRNLMEKAPTNVKTLLRAHAQLYSEVHRELPSSEAWLRFLRRELIEIEKIRGRLLTHALATESFTHFVTTWERNAIPKEWESAFSVPRHVSHDDPDEMAQRLDELRLGGDEVKRAFTLYADYAAAFAE